jgi:hypothetical protein
MFDRFAELARRLTGRRRPEPAGRPLSLGSVIWAEEGLYPEAPARAMKLLEFIGVHALEFGWRGDQYGETFFVAHLKDGRRFQFNFSYDLTNEGAAFVDSRDNGHDWASGVFTEWAGRQKVIFAKAGDSWRFARRPETVEGLLLHPEMFEKAKNLTLNNETLGPWWASAASWIAGGVLGRMPKQEAQVFREAIAREREKERLAALAEARDKALAASIDEQVAHAFPAHLRAQAKASLEQKDLAAALGENRADSSAPSAPKAPGNRL